MKIAGGLLAADELVGVGLLGEHLKGGLDDATENAEHEVESRLLLDVIVRKGAAVLELFSGEDETLLIRGNACDNREWNQAQQGGATTRTIQKTIQREEQPRSIVDEDARTPWQNG